jgi:hypothetical protein
MCVCTRGTVTLVLCGVNRYEFRIRQMNAVEVDAAPAIEFEHEERPGSSLLPPIPTSSARHGWFCAFWLNMCVLWAYQSLVSAQNYYIAIYPAADLSFWGTVSVGVAMVAGQLISMGFRLEERLGYDGRVLFAYAGFAAIGLAVLAAPSAGLILFAFGASGFLNTLSESPLYDLAALWGEGGRLIGAINLGNGSAGVLNISLDLLIRLCSLAALGGDVSTAGEADHIAHTLFLSLLVVMSLSCIPIYLHWTRRIPAFRTRILAAARQRRTATAAADREWRGGGRSALAGYLRVARNGLLGVSLAELVTFAVTLAIWPGLPCGAPINGTWFESNPEWFCSPCVIGVFNAADWVGRWLGTLPSADRVLGSPRRLYAATTLRCLFVPIVAALSTSERAQPGLLFATLGAVGLSNGVIGTLCFMRAQALVADADREVASRLMVLSLYAGIAAGSIFAALAFRG